MTAAADRYRTVLEVGATLAASLDLDELLATIARQVGEAMDVWGCDIHDYSAADNTLTYSGVWTRELTEEDLAYVGTVVSLDERPACAEVVLEQHAVEAYVDDESMDPVERELMAQWGEKATLEVPLIYGDEVIGVLGVVETRHIRRFEEQDRSLLAALSVPVAIAIHNAHTYGAEQKRRRQLGAMLDASRAVTSSLVLEEVLETVAREATELLGCPECLIYEYDPHRHGTVWRTQFARGEPHDWEDALGTFYSAEEWPEDYELIVAGEVGVEHADDPGLRDEYRKYMRHHGETASLSVPLRYGGEPIGVLYLVQFEEPREFDEHEIELARAFGELASAAIHNARLFRRQERQSGRLVNLFEASRSITGALGVDDVIRSVFEEVGRALPGDGAVVRVWMSDGDAFEVFGTEAAADLAPPDAVTGAAATLSPVQEAVGAGARLALPFAARGEVAGLIEVVDAGRRAFGDDLIELLQIIANHAAVAVENARLYARVQTQAITDGLTELYNHRYFYERLEQECARARRYDLPLSVLMMDIDDFKAFNDRHGHQRGDEVLRGVAAILLQGTRRGVDLPARYGGEEFAVILPHTSADGAGVVGARLQRTIAEVLPPPGAGAALVGERLRQGIADSDFSASGGPAHVTVSIGIASAEGAGVRDREIVSCADKALYVAKRSGKNRVEVYA